MLNKRNILSKVCTCGKRMGYYSKEFEDTLFDKVTALYEVQPGLQDNEVENDIERRKLENEVLQEFGWTKMCCRSTYITARKPFIRDSNKDSYYDEFGIEVNTDFAIIETLDKRNGYEFKPKRMFPLFFEEVEEKPEEKKEVKLLPTTIKRSIVDIKRGRE